MIKDNIRTLRTIAGLSQQQLAEQLCVSHKTISHWEKGYTEPPISAVVKMKYIFNVSYEELLETDIQE